LGEKSGGQEGKFSSPSKDVRFRADVSPATLQNDASPLMTITCGIHPTYGDPSTHVCEIKNEVLTSLNAYPTAAPLTPVQLLTKQQRGVSFVRPMHFPAFP
jgi:hypothetical protein